MSSPAAHALAPARGCPRLVHITKALAWSEFKLRYAGSFLGYFWSFAKPLMLFGVLYGVFHVLLRLGEGVERFPETLLLGIVLWSFFTEATAGGVVVLVARADMLRKVAFPAVALPIAVTLTATFALFFNLVTVLVLLLTVGIEPTVYWLWLPFLLAELFLTTLGVSLILSALYVTMRDIGQLWDVLSQLLFYATPIIYPLVLVPASVDGLPFSPRALVMCNPIAQIIEQTKLIVVYGESGSLSDVLGGWHVLIPYAMFVAVLTCGILLFRRASVRMVEQL